jgi:phospholipid/cholesterol/gamma-HCH transport system substrate-binding protein
MNVWHRYANEVVGAVVVAAGIAFLAAVLHAGVLKDWFTPSVTLRLLLPDAGMAGLSVGADVEILGTRAGTVRRIVIDPTRQMYAEVSLEPQMRVFVRADSTAVIRKRFGVAGDAFVDISRGTGRELDWEFAVLAATTERAPTDTIGQILDEVREKVMPLIDETGKAVQGLAAVAQRLQDADGPFERTMTSLASISGRIDRGEGILGKVLSDEQLAEQLTAIVGDARKMVNDASSLMAEMDKATRDSRLQDIMKRTESVLAALQVTTTNLARASPQFTQITQNVAAGTANLPALLLQAQLSARELELMLTQLRSHWLLGGGSTQPAPRRLPVSNVR